MEMKVPFKGRNKRTCTGGFRDPCARLHTLGDRTAFYYLSCQHLIEQHAVGPPVHRLVVGLVGHDLQREEIKRQRQWEKSEKKSGSNWLRKRGRRREVKRERVKVGGRRKRKR